jgi:hypothetical protein
MEYRAQLGLVQVHKISDFLADVHCCFIVFPPGWRKRRTPPAEIWQPVGEKFDSVRINSGGAKTFIFGQK